MTQKRITITEKEQRVIKWISSLSDKELFGLECFLAGIRMTTNKTPASTNQPQRKIKGNYTKDE